MFMSLINRRFIVLVSLIIVFIIGSCNAQESNQKIHWMSFEEAVKKNETVKKKLFIDVYTHWCGWCKRMDASTFLIDSIADYMNEKFYAVKLDAETKDTIHFKEQTFVFRP
jgi:thioredoxin-related protein